MAVTLDSVVDCLTVTHFTSRVSPHTATNTSRIRLTHTLNTYTQEIINDDEEEKTINTKQIVVVMMKKSTTYNVMPMQLN